MEEKIKKLKRGRKPIPEDQKKKKIWAILKPEIYSELSDEIESGQAESHGQRVAQIVELYYKNKDKKDRKEVA